MRNLEIRGWSGYEGIVDQVCHERKVWKSRIEERGASLRDGNQQHCSRKNTQREAKKAME